MAGQLNIKEIDAINKQVIALKNNLLELLGATKNIDQQTTKGNTQRKDLLKVEKQILGNRNDIKIATRDANKIQKQSLEIALGRTKAGKEVNRTLKKQRDELRKLRGTQGKFLTNLRNIAIAYIGIRQAIRGLKNAFKTIIQFQSANAKLASILGTTRERTLALQEQQKQLGSSYKFTATETANLQIELAKLGFTQTDILSLTESVIKGSIALGTGLSEAATLTGSVIRAFGLDVTESQRVIDILSDSTTKSALDFEKLDTALGIVSPVAKNANVSLEATVAQLGALVNRGVDASTAATGLRNAYLELASQGITLDEAFVKIGASSDKNATSLALFGKKGATIGTILANTILEVDNFTTALVNSGGASDRIVKEQMSSLHFAIDNLKSSYEGLILSIEDGDKGTAKIIKNLLILGTKALDALAEGSKSAQQKISELANEKALGKLEELLKSTTLEGELFNKWTKEAATAAEELAREYNKELIILLDGNRFQRRRNEARIEELQLLAATQFALQNLLLDQKREDKEVENRIENIDKINTGIKEQIKLTTELTGLEKARIQNVETFSSEEIALNEAERDAKIDTANVAFDFANTLGDRQLQNIEKRNKAGIISDKEAAIAVAKIQRRQALLDKAQALFNIAINTFQAAAKVTAQTGIGALIAAPAITAFGIAQAILVAAQPIPQIPKFEKGTKSAPGGAAIVGEKGHELGILPSGQAFLTPDTATLIPDLPKGTEIIPHMETQMMMYGGMTSDKADEIIVSNKEVRKAILSKPERNTIIDKNGFRFITKENNTYTEWLNKYIAK